MLHADVLIAGAGPAGLTAALALRERGLSVSIVASRSQSNSVELVSPHIKSLLEKVSAEAALNAETTRPSFGVSAAWGAQQPRFESSVTNPFGSALAINRSTFDAALLRLAADRGVEVIEGTVERVTRADGRLCAEVTCPHQRSLNGRSLVDATGRRALVARQLGARRERIDSLSSFSAEFPSAATDRVIHVEACEFGWWYMTHTHRGTKLVSFFTDAPIAAGLGAAEPTAWFGLLGGTRIAESGAFTQAPTEIVAQSCNTSMLNQCVGDDWVAVGDAAAVFDPLGSAGVMKAIDSGIRGAAGLCAQLRGKPELLLEYDSWIRRASTTFLAAQCRHYALERRWPKSRFWASRAPQQRA